MAHLVEVAFRGNRKEFFQWDGDVPPPLKAAVIVEVDRGEDLGFVHASGELAEIRCRGCAHGCGTAQPASRALRLATTEEEKASNAMAEENEVTRRRAMERVRANDLVMKLTDAEWQFDRRKLTLYFTAERRVDFRGLVRDLASMFRTRIELKQIGVRDEAKRLSGVGRCGREYCSASWLPELRPVNLGVAKDQKLSLNPQQISGACGRLMCCLRYEHEFYVQSRRRFPKEGKILITSLGEEKVLACDIFNDRVTLRTSEGDTRVVALADLRAETEGADEPEETMETTSDSTGQALLRDVAYTAEDVEALDEVDSEIDELIIDDIVPIPVSILLEVDVPLVVPPASLPTETPGGEAPGEAPMQAGRAEDAATPRRKRRRGRRGGRRLRAAEGRAGDQGTGTDDAHGDSAESSNDGDDDDANDDPSDN